MMRSFSLRLTTDIALATMLLAALAPVAVTQSSSSADASSSSVASVSSASSTSSAASTSSASSVSSSSSEAPPQEGILLLRPHCDTEPAMAAVPSTIEELLENGAGSCGSFDIRDPKSLETPILHVGDILDADIVLFNPSRQSVRKVRVWLSYDSSTLDGLSIDTEPAFPVKTPGEADFSPDEGFVKLSVETDGQDISAPLVPVARIQWKVLRVPTGGKAPISVYDSQPGLLGHTYVQSPSDTNTKNLISTDLPSLVAQVEKEGASSSSSTSAASSDDSSEGASSSDGSSSSSSSMHAAPDERTPFVLLQVQNLRIGTEGSAMYLAWDALPSSELVGYNVYYGTEQGRYIQRRSLTSDTKDVSIRGLTAGATYFVAVRAVNGKGEESAFSQEVSVTLGNPSTSTAPLNVKSTGGPNGKNPLQGQVTGGQSFPGESGTSSMTLLLLLLSSVAGVGLALRRQFSASRPAR